MSAIPKHIRIIIKRFTGNPLMQRVMRNSGYIFSATTFSAGLSMIQGILAARMLGVEAFGMLSPITQFVTNINRLTSFRMSELVVNYVGEFSAKGQDRLAAAVFKAAGITEILSSLIAYGLVFFLAPLGAEYIVHDPVAASLIRLYALVLLANLIAESATGLLQYFNQFRIIAIITIGQSILTIAIILMAFIIGGNLQTVVIAYLLGKVSGALATTGVALWQASKEWGVFWWRTPLSLLAPRYRELIRFGVSTNLSGTVNLVTRDSDTLWLSALSSPLQVGYYKVAKAFMNVLVIPVNPLISTTYREIARETAKRQWDNVRYLLRSGSLLSTIYTIPASLILVIFGPWLVCLYGPEFGPAYGPMLILMLGFLAANIFYWNRIVLLPLGLPDYPTKIGFVMAGLQIALMLWLVPLWGANGQAVALSFFFIGTVSILVWKGIREIQRMEQQPAVSKGD